jgi:adenylate cyclase
MASLTLQRLSKLVTQARCRRARQGAAVQSKIAAVLVADIAGYGRLMEASERGTHARLMALRRNVIDPTLDLHAGRIIKRTGDGLIAIF